MARFIVCLLFVFGFFAVASAQEQAPKAPASADQQFLKLQQVIADLYAEQDLRNQYFMKEIADSKHQEAQLREECAALKAKLDSLESDYLENRLSDALVRKVELRDKAIADIDLRLAAMRTVSAGCFGLRQQRVYAITGEERTALVARRDRLQKERTQAMAEFMRHVSSLATPMPSVSAFGFGSITY